MCAFPKQGLLPRSRRVTMERWPILAPSASGAMLPDCGGLGGASLYSLHGTRPAAPEQIPPVGSRSEAAPTPRTPQVRPRREVRPAVQERFLWPPTFAVTTRKNDSAVAGRSGSHTVTLWVRNASSTNVPTVAHQRTRGNRRCRRSDASKMGTDAHSTELGREVSVPRRSRALRGGERGTDRGICVPVPRRPTESPTRVGVRKGGAPTNGTLASVTAS